MEKMEKVLDQIREAIKSSGKPCNQISLATGISRSRLSKLMSGQLGLSIEALEQLVEYLGLEIQITNPKKGKK
jgi:predicted XRE-type DNA-binding protein